jgi:hypothetical protein
MKDNESLRLSVCFKERVKKDLSHAFYEMLPASVIETAARCAANSENTRERIFTPPNTVYTMLLGCVQEDKSLQNTMNLFKKVFDSRSQALIRAEQARLAEAKANASLLPKKPGRPKGYKIRLPKTMQKPVSSNTAAYSKARTGLDMGVVSAVFAHSAQFGARETESWHGLKTHITDGTCLQLQNTPDIRSRYAVKGKHASSPQALLQVMIRQGSGQVKRFAVGSRQDSELTLILPMLAELEAGSLLLADDLYNTYYHFSLVLSRQSHVIVPGKRDRLFTVVSGTEDDQIVELSKTTRPSYVDKEQWAHVPPTLRLRRITYSYPTKNGMEEAVLYTTLLDAKIKACEIITKYAMRWDIEISIREIKTLMDINVLRSKSESMMFKELFMALCAYNLVRKIIAQSADSVGFSPQESVFQKCAAFGRTVLLDKKGRVFFKWSPGRNGYSLETNKQTHHPASKWKTKALPTKNETGEPPKI